MDVIMTVHRFYTVFMLLLIPLLDMLIVVISRTKAVSVC